MTRREKPRKVIQFGDFRLVHRRGWYQPTLEEGDGIDALGVKRWKSFGQLADFFTTNGISMVRLDLVLRIIRQLGDELLKRSKRRRKARG